MYTVTFINAQTGAFEISRYFNTIKAARNWARWLLKQNFVEATSLYRGPAGGEKLETHSK